MRTLENNCIIAAKNEIDSMYQGVLNAKEVGKRLEKGTLEALIESVKTWHNLSNTIIITSDSIRTRIKRRNISITFCTGGLYSPLLSIEADAIEVMKQMARIRASLTPSDGLRLINSSIIDTAAQEDLIAWNHKYSHIRYNVDQVGAKICTDV